VSRSGLHIVVSADAREVERGLGRAQRSADRFGEGVQRSLGNVDLASSLDSSVQSFDAKGQTAGSRFREGFVGIVSQGVSEGAANFGAVAGQSATSGFEGEFVDGVGQTISGPSLFGALTQGFAQGIGAAVGQKVGQKIGDRIGNGIVDGAGFLIRKAAGLKVGQSFKDGLSKQQLKRIGTVIGVGIGAAIAAKVVSSAVKGVTSLPGKLTRAIGGIGNLSIPGLEVLGNVGNAIGGAITTFKDFDQAMTQTGVISQASAEDLASLRAEAERLGANTSKGAVEIGTMTVALARAGFSAQESEAALEGIVRGSEATGASLEDLATVGGGLIKSFSNVGLTAGSTGLQVSDMQGVMDSLVVTANSVNTDVTSLGFGMRNLAANANSTGQPLNDMLVALGLLQDSMLAGETGGTALSTALQQVSDLSAGGGPADAQEYWQQLGINARNADGSMRPLLEILPELRHKLEQVAPSERDLILSTLFGADGGKAMKILLSKSQADIDALTQKVNESGGASVQAGEQMQQGLGGALAQLNSALEGLALKFGGAIAPLIEGFAKLISSFLSQFNESGAFDELQAGFEQIQGALEAIAADEELMEGVSDAIAEIVKVLGELTADGLEQIANWLSANADQIPAMAEEFKKFALGLIEMGVEMAPILGVLESIIGLLLKVGGALAQVYSVIHVPLFNFLLGVIDALASGLSSLLDSISSIGGAIGSLTSSILGFGEATEKALAVTGGAAKGSAALIGGFTEAGQKLKKTLEESSGAAEGLADKQEAGAKRATQVAKKSVGDRLKLESGLAQQSINLAAKGNDTKLKDLENANAKAESELQKAADEEKKIEEQKQKELEEIRNRRAEREFEVDQASTTQTIEIRQQELSGDITSDQADALISEQAVDDAQAAIGIVKASIEDLNEARNKGLIDEQEYAEQSRDLQGELADNNLQLIEKQLAAKKQANEAALELIREEQAAREAALESENLNEEIGIRQQQLSGAITGDEAEALISQKAVTDARERINLVRLEIQDLQKAKQDGLIEDKEANQQLRQLDQELLNGRLAAMRAELAEKQRVQQEAVRLIEAEGMVAKAALDNRVQAIDRVTQGLQQQQGLLGAAADLQSALADQENARFEAAITAAETDEEKQKIAAQHAEAKVEQLLAAQEIERQQLELSHAQADADLARQSVLAEIAQLEAEIALEKLKATDASDQEIAAQERILDLRKQQIADLKQAAQVQNSIQDLQTQTLGVRQQTARQRLSTEVQRPVEAPPSRSPARPSSGGSTGAPSRERASSRASSPRRSSGFGSGSRQLTKGARALNRAFQSSSQQFRGNIGEQKGRLTQGIRAFQSGRSGGQRENPSSRAGSRSGRGLPSSSSGGGRPPRQNLAKPIEGVEKALGKLDQGGGDANGVAGLGEDFGAKMTSLLESVESLKAEVIKISGNPMPNSLTVTTPDPVNDANKVLMDIQRRAAQ